MSNRPALETCLYAAAAVANFHLRADIIPAGTLAEHAGGARINVLPKNLVDAPLRIDCRSLDQEHGISFKECL